MYKKTLEELSQMSDDDLLYMIKENEKEWDWLDSIF